jgi:hypothetical protein
VSAGYPCAHAALSLRYATQVIRGFSGFSESM